MSDLKVHFKRYTANDIVSKGTTIKVGIGGPVVKIKRLRSTTDSDKTQYDKVVVYTLNNEELETTLENVRIKLN